MKKQFLEHQERLEAIVETTGALIVLTDPDGRIILFNRACEELTGCKRDEVFGKTIVELFLPAEWIPIVKERFADPYAPEVRAPHENPWITKSGEERLIEWRCTIIPSPENGRPCILGTGIDITERKRAEEALKESRDAFFNMLRDLDFSYRELKKLHEGLIYSFVNAIDAKSPWTKGHSIRVTNYALAIATEMGLKDKDIETLRTAALLHDIGKIGTYDIVLDKPEKLTAEEFDLVKMHPAKGEEILMPIKQLQNVLPIIRSHHERMDGKGYPDGLKGDEIPLLARIICLADAFDSMTSERPYRPAPGKEYAISELKRCSGTQFDSQAVKVFLSVLSKS